MAKALQKYLILKTRTNCNESCFVASNTLVPDHDFFPSVDKIKFYHMTFSMGKSVNYGPFPTKVLKVGNYGHLASFYIRRYPSIERPALVVTNTTLKEALVGDSSLFSSFFLLTPLSDSSTLPENAA